MGPDCVLVRTVVGADEDLVIGTWKDGRIGTKTNHHGGVIGGITTGEPLVVRMAVKPTPSIALRQQTVDVRAGENTELAVTGRHDPCIVPRAVVVVESALAIALCELMMDDSAHNALSAQNA